MSLTFSLFALSPEELIAQNPALAQQVMSDPSLLSKLKGNAGEQVVAKQEVQKINNEIVAKENSVTKKVSVDTKKIDYTSATPLFYKTSDKRLEKILEHQVRISTEKLKRYGAQFLKNNNEVNPASLPVPDDYIINVGDIFDLSLYGKSNKNKQVTVNHNGDILISELGAVHVAGMPFNKAKAKLIASLESAYSSSTAYVDLSTFSSIQVTITGQVYAPGIYNVQSFSTVLDALKTAQGVLPEGSMRNVLLKRNGKTIAHFDLYALIRYGVSKNNKFLRFGDVIVVPSIQNDVSLLGAVRTPGIFELKKNETLADLLNYASNLSATAKKFGIKVKRFDENSHISIESVALSDAKKYRLKKGDIVYVRPISDREIKSVSLFGNVVFPGERSIKKSKSLSALFEREIKENSYEGLFLDDTNMIYGLVKRLSRLNHEVISFNLGDVLSKKSDVQLQNSDEIYIFNNMSVKENPYVYVKGDALDKPIKLQYYTGLKLRDVYNSVDFKSESIEEGVRYRVFADTKQIKVDRESEEGKASFILDLEKDSDFTLKPYDEVSILDFYTTHALETVAISGEVIIPKNYVYQKGMGINDLIGIAGGTTTKAYLKTFEVSHFNIVEGERIKSVENLSLVTAMKDNFKLQPYDEVKLFAIPNWHESKFVRLSGQVKFPGRYSIESGEKLSHVIERAGGYTDVAFIKGAVFTRLSLAVRQKDQMRQSVSKMKQKALYFSNSSEKFGEIPGQKQSLVLFTEEMAKEAEKYAPIGRITIQLDEKTYTSEDSDIVLEDGDVLHVPTHNDTIFVFGEVLNQNTFIFKKGLSVDEYIQAAGGFDDIADEEAVYVVRANGLAVRYEAGWFSSRITVQAGDTIIVPMKLDYVSGWQMVKESSTIFYQMSLGVAAILALSR